MSNVQISDLPFAITPLVGATTFFEVEATEGGVVVSRRVAADDLVVSATTLFIKGTSTDDPSIGGGVFDGQLLWQNANGLQTGVFGFDPAGDNFIWSNDAEGGFHQIAIRDGTVLVETIAAAAGGLLVNNLLTGAGLERVLTTADAFAGPIGTSTDDPAVLGGTFDGILNWQNANLIDTATIGFEPAGDSFNIVNKARGGNVLLRQVIGDNTLNTFYSFDGTSGRHEWTDPQNGNLIKMLLEAGLSAVTAVALNVNSPATGAVQLGQFRIEIQDGEVAGLFGFPETASASTTLRMKNFVHGGAIAIVGEDAGGVEREILSGDPDGSSSMNQVGVRVATTLTAAAGGLSANNTLTGGGFERVLTEADAFTGIIQGSSTDSPETPGGTWDGVLRFDNANDLQTARVGFDPAGDSFYVQPTVEGGRLILGGRSPGAPGVLRESLIFDFDTGGLPAGSTRFFETNGTAEQMRLDTGVSAITNVANVGNSPSSGLGQHGQLKITNNNAEQSGEFGFPASGGVTTTMRMKNFVHGGPLELVGENAAGTERILYFYDPDNSGPIIFGPLDNDPTTDASIQDTRLTFRNPSAETIWQIGFLEGNNDFSIKLFQDTGTLRLRGSSAASADTLLATFDPVADAKLFQAGAEVFRTVGAAAGGAQANNTLTGAGFERVLTTADLSGSPFTEIILTNSNVIDLVDTDVALNIGAAVPGSNPHLEIGFTVAGTDLGMQAKADATSVLELELNRLGGNVRVGSQNTAIAGQTYLYASNGVAAGAVIETVISGMILEGKAGGSTIFDMHAVLGTLAMRQSYNGANYAFEGFVSSEEIRFSSRNSSAAVRELIFLDPDDDVEIYHPATDRIALRTTDLGADILGENTTTSEFGFFSTDGLTERARLRTDAAGLQLSSRVNGAGVSMRLLSSGGVEWVTHSGSGSTGTADMRWTGLIRAITASSGLTVRGNAANNVLFLMEGSTGIDHMAMRGESTRVIWDGLIDSSLLLIRGNNAASASIECAVFDPDGFAQLKFAGAITLETHAVGINVRGDGADSANITFEDTGVSDIGQIDISGSAMLIECAVDSNPINFVGRSSGSVTRQLIQADPDDDIALFDDGTEVARTLPAASGGWEANNTLTGAGFERVLTIADRRSAAAYTPTNVVTTRTYDANATTIDEIADVLGTLIADLQAIDVIQ